MTFEEAAACVRDWCALTPDPDVEEHAVCLYSTDAEMFTVWFMDADEEYFEERANTPAEYHEMKGRYLRAAP